jgi:hypothetical protein
VAKVDLGGVAERLFLGFLAPLVLGGPIAPGRPIGARAALALGDDRSPADSEILSRVQLARVRVARRLIPLDRFDGPNGAAWALAAALHDIVQSSHPSLNAPLRRSAPAKLVALANATVERVPAPATVAEALVRHTWFSRALEITRTDTTVSWWVGKSTFLGAPAPARLTAWPELRRVHVESVPRPLIDLPAAGGAVDGADFALSLGLWLSRSPLTDLATCARAVPAFAWSADTLALVATPTGRRLALRAMALDPLPPKVDLALGRATKRLFAARAWKQVSPALDLLAERALADAQVTGPRPEPVARAANDDAAFARGAGAIVARQWLDRNPTMFSEEERRRITQALDAARATAHGIEAMLAPMAKGPP